MISSSVDQTKKIAQNLAASLEKAKVVALYGGLGSGKTAFTQFIAESLGVKSRLISPTFVVLRSYKVENKPYKFLHHFDLYRLQNAKEASLIGIEEIINQKDSLVVIEWPEIIEGLLPTGTIKVRFKNLGGEKREIKVS